jgi:hypothetical protein
VERLTTAFDLDTLVGVGELFEQRDDFSRKVLAVVDTREVGLAVGHALPTRSMEALAAVTLLLKHRDSALVTGLAPSLLGRAARDDNLLGPVLNLIAGVGVDNFSASVNTKTLGGSAASVLATAMTNADVGPRDFDRLLRSVPEGAVAHILEVMPTKYLNYMKGRLTDLLTGKSENVVEAVLTALERIMSGETLTMVGSTLLQHDTRAWRTGSYRSVCAKLAEHGYGSDYLVPLVRNRSARERLRTTALKSLEDDDELLREATKFRLAELFDPPKLRAEIRQHRKRLKTGVGDG